MLPHYTDDQWESTAALCCPKYEHYYSSKPQLSQFHTTDSEYQTVLQLVHKENQYIS